MPMSVNDARIPYPADDGRCLDSVQLQKLEQSFRSWVETPMRADTRMSRRRVLLIFLLIRYTGARLNEVFRLDPFNDIDYKNHIVHLCKGGAEKNRPCRQVEISEALSSEIRETLEQPGFVKAFAGVLSVDPGHVRRKFYDRAESIGVPRELGAPDMLRRARAVELLQSNVPLPVVQRILGHSTPNLVASYMKFSDDDIRQAVRYFIDKESQRKTSARNAFFGKIDRIQKGDVQSIAELISLGGFRVRAAITNHSVARLGLKRGALVIAEVKAPWMMLYKGEEEPRTTAENVFCGRVHRMTKGRMTTEVVVRLEDGTELCSIITDESRKRLDVQENDVLWLAFNAFTVVLHVD